MTAVAGRQHGVIAYRQLLACGLSAKAVGHRVRTGRLHRVHRGVYLVGHPVPPPLGQMAAALLAVGAGAVLSHRAAAALWGMTAAAPGAVDVTVAGRTPRRRPGIRVHGVAALASHDLTRRHGLPVTSPARTLVDVAAVLSPRDLERAVADALVRRWVTRRDVALAAARVPRSRGGARLRAVLALDRPASTRSEAEHRLLSLARTARLPEPEVNVRLAGHCIDFLWRASRLVVEVDSRTTHDHDVAFEADRRRDRDLLLAGFRVLRVTVRRLDDEPHAVLADLVRALHA